MKLTLAQKNIVNYIAEVCSDKMKSNDGYCEAYDVTHGHKAKENVLNRLVDMGIVIKWHSKQKSRYAWQGSCHNDDGFTLYKLAPVGIKMVYARIKKEEERKTLGLRIARAMKEYQFDAKDLKKAGITLDN